MSSEEPIYIINSVYGFTNDEKKETTEDFLFYTYKEGMDPTTKMKIVRNTTRPFYVIKPGLRYNNIKRQTVPLVELDMYTAREKDLPNELAKALGVKKQYVKLKDLCQTPYVHGADIPFSYIYRANMAEQTKKIAEKKNLPSLTPHSLLRKGAFDIETSVLGGKEVILLSFVDHDFNVYTAIYEPFLKGTKLEEVKSHVNKVFGEGTTDDKIAKYGLKFNYYIGDELGCIKWIWEQMHNTNVDFISIWNMKFDIPYVMDRLEFLKCPVEDIFCNPKIPQRYRKVKYVQGTTKPSDHFTDAWHWMYCTAAHAFYDSMCLFGRLNKSNGLLESYRLGYVMDLMIKETKLFAKEEMSHHDMQTHRFLDYIAYNQWDAILLVAFEHLKKNVNNMVGLNGINSFDIFNKSTVKGKYSYYTYCLKEKQCVTCSVMGDNTTEYDKEITAGGGNVLDPTRAVELGTPYLTESRRRSSVNVKNSDIDAEAMYPNISQVINDSRDTAIHTIISINGIAGAVEDFCSHLVGAAENAIYLCSKYFNLPSVTEMLALYRERKNKR